MRNNNCRVFLEKGADANHLNALLPRLVILDIEAHEDVDLPDGEQLQAVDLRAPHLDRHIEAILFVGAFGERLIQPAMFGLCEPVGLESHFLLSNSERGGGQQRQDQQCLWPAD